MILWATLGVSVARNADEGFQRRKKSNKQERQPQNFPYLKLTLSVSVVWFSYLTVLAIT